MDKRRANIYDIYLSLMIFSLSFGQIGGSFQLSRICFILLTPPMISCLKYYRKLIEKVNVVFFLFFFFCILSLAWTSDVELGFKEIIYYIIIYLSVIEFLIFWKKSNKPISTISKAWLFSFLITGLIALWEIRTGNHLSVAYMEEKTLKNGVDAAHTIQFASSTFGNYNTYVVFICFALPFVIYSISMGIFYKILGFVSLLISTIVLFSNASRGGLIAYAIILLVSLWIVLSKKRFGYLLLLFCMAVLLMIIYSLRDVLFENILYRIANGGMFEDTGRRDIWLTAISLGMSTFCIGTGVGSLLASMSVLRHGENPLTHNIFLEIFVQYGFLFAVLFVWFLYTLFRKSKKSNDTIIKAVCLSTCIAMPFIFIINSSYLTMSSLWIFLFSIYAFVNDSRHQVMVK